MDLRMRRSQPLIVCLSLLVGGSALAVSSYPSVLRQESGAARSPRCIVCHQTNSGGSGTSTQPFSIALQDRGMTGSGTDSVRSAFAQLKQDEVDTDGDGTLDADEITQARDPNIALNLAAGVDDAMFPTRDGGTVPGEDGGDEEPPFLELPDLHYGIGCSSAGGAQAAVGLLLLGAGALRLSRRRR